MQFQVAKIKLNCSVYVALEMFKKNCLIRLNCILIPETRMSYKAHIEYAVGQNCFQIENAKYSLEEC